MSVQRVDQVTAMSASLHRQHPLLPLHIAAPSREVRTANLRNDLPVFDASPIHDFIFFRAS